MLYTQSPLKRVPYLLRGKKQYRTYIQNIFGLIRTRLDNHFL